MKEKGKKTDRKKQRSGASYRESVRAKWFCCAFKLGFVQLICKASLILSAISSVNKEISCIPVFSKQGRNKL